MQWRRWIHAVRARGRSIVRPRQADDDLHDELSFHVAMQTQSNVQSGMNTVDAERRARMTLGGLEPTKEIARDARPLRWPRDAMQDLRYALRALRRTPAFAIVAVVTLALGIGANTALFSVISAVILRPLPYPDSNRLVRVWTAQANNGLARSGSALPDYRAWRSENRTLDELGAYHFINYTITDTDRPEVLPAARVTASVWTVLRAQASHGRVFSTGEERWGAHRVVVLSDRLWQRRFGGDPRVVGQAVQLNGQPFTVIGVMPPSFMFPVPLTELWSPIAYAPGDNMDSRDNRFVEMLGRLKSGVASAEALADLSTIADRLRQAYPENAGVRVTVEQWLEAIVGPVRPTLLFLLGAVGFVLLIACANVANLLIARSMARQHELTVRATIGASRGRLVRQLLTEHLVLASISAIVGVVVASALIRGVAALGPIGVPRLTDVTIDGRVVAFAVALALLTGLAFGVWPAFHAGRMAAAGRLKDAARTIVGGRMRIRARQALVTAEVALSLALLVGAVLLIISLNRVLQVDPGFHNQQLLTAALNLPPVRYRNAEQVAQFLQSAVDAIGALPGIRSAGSTTTLPLGGNEWGKYFTIDGRPAPPSLAQVPNVNYRQVAPSYFQTMGATIRRGRFFTNQDGRGQPLVAIVNESLAHRFWPNADPIGQRVSMTPPESLMPAGTFPLPGGRTSFPRRIIVGVIADFRQNGLERDANVEVFVPLAQTPPEFMTTHFLVARTTGDPLAAADMVQAAVTRLDRNLALSNVRTMDSRLADSLAQRRVVMMLLGASATLALILALLGLYGVITYTVSQRRQELGVRAALGASAADLLRLVVADGLWMTAPGAGLGLLLAAALSQLMTTQLFRVEPIDTTVYAGVTALFVIVAGLACGVPALRAARVDPAAVLRNE